LEVGEDARVSGRKNIDRSLRRLARKHVAEACRALKNLRSNETVMSKISVRVATHQCESDLEYLATLVKEVCRHCGKNVDFGNNTCASCADERGP